MGSTAIVWDEDLYPCDLDCGAKVDSNPGETVARACLTHVAVICKSLCVSINALGCFELLMNNTIKIMSYTSLFGTLAL